jgi:hypothetical protein
VFSWDEVVRIAGVKVSTSTEQLNHTGVVEMPKLEWVSRLAIASCFSAAAILLFLASPTNLDFWWQDAPRHALNGAFVFDFFKAIPLRHPYQWAMSYYGQYPALTIGFYPPVFYFFEALIYSLFGVSHAAAQACVAVFTAGLGLGAYLLARNALPKWPALCAGLLAIGIPEMAFWGRQVMLDIPAMTFLVFGVWQFGKFVEGNSTRSLVYATTLLLLSIYTKYNEAFILPVLLIALFSARGKAWLKDLRIWIAGGAGLLALVPAVIVNTVFIKTNVSSVVGGRTGDYPVWSINAWTFYPQMLPHQLGYLTFLLLFAGIIVWIFRGARSGPRWFVVLLAAWFLVGLAVFSAIALREPRHDLPVLLPLIIAGVWGLSTYLTRWWWNAGGIVFATGVLIHSAEAYPVPRLEGYERVADYVTATAPRNAAVIVSGFHDADFIFALTHIARCDLRVVCADRLFLNVAIERERGVGLKNYSEDQIAEVLRQTGASLIVAQAGFWDDLTVMRRFEQVLRTTRFTRVAGVPLTGAVSTSDGRGAHGEPRVEIFRPNGSPVTVGHRGAIGLKNLSGEFQAATQGCTDNP